MAAHVVKRVSFFPIISINNEGGRGGIILANGRKNKPGSAVLTAFEI